MSIPGPDSGISGFPGAYPAGASARAFAAGLSAPARAMVPALAAAANRTGVDFNALYHTARLESGFNPNAKARTSSATGLFQFIESSWLNVVARHGARHGLTPASRDEALALRTDPMAASLMAAEHMADNAEHLESRLGREAQPVDLYLAHFLGAGGAVRFLEALQTAPGQSAARLLPAAARANRAIFYENGEPRSLADVHALFSARLGASPLPAAQDASQLPPARATQPTQLAARDFGASGLPRTGEAQAWQAPVAFARAGFVAMAHLAASDPDSDLFFADRLAAIPQRLSDHVNPGAINPGAFNSGLANSGLANSGSVNPADAARLAYLLLADMGG